MKTIKQNQEPSDAKERRAIKPVISYPIDNLPKYDSSLYADARDEMKLVETIIIPPREAKTFEVPAGHFFRIVSVDGPQVGDLNLWNKDNINERFFSGKTRALTERIFRLVTGCGQTSRICARLLQLVTIRLIGMAGMMMAGSVHDVIGTRCDPYTNNLLSGNQYHNCCHSNLTRALARSRNLSLSDAEGLIHDVMCLCVQALQKKRISTL